MTKTRMRQKRATTPSMIIARHGAGDAVVVEREPLRIRRKAADGVAQDIAAVVVAQIAFELIIGRDQP